MADNTLDVTPPFKFEIKTPPRGMTDYDPAAIDPVQQENLNLCKLYFLRENLHYLTTHPEVRGLYAWMVMHLWKIRPRNVFPVIGAKHSLGEVPVRKEVKSVIEEENFHIHDELVESDGEEWDY